MKRLLFITLLVIPFCADGQIITLFAGGGTIVGDGGPATSANIPDPDGGVFDKLGNYYFVSNAGGNRVRKIDIAGVITTIAGTGVLGYNGDGITATTAQLNSPNAVTLDSAGNLYIADAHNNRVRKVDMTTGMIYTYAGNGTTGYSGDSGLATAAAINDPQDICFDKFGNLYIGDYNNSRVRKVSTLGIITTLAGTGVPGYSGDGGLADTSKIGGVAGVCADTGGNIYLADNSNSRIFKVGTDGIITTFAGTSTGYLYNGDAIPATTANIDPYRITFDDTGNLFIAEYHNYRVRKVDMFGIIHTVVGNGISGTTGEGGPALDIEMDYPSGVAFDACGNLYITETANKRVSKVTFNTLGIPNIIISANPGDTVCKQPVTYTATVSYGSPISYQWYVDGVSTGATNSTYVYTPTNGDSVRCMLIATSQCSGDIDTVSSNTINMVVTPATVPAVTLTGSTIVAVGSIATVNATVTGAGSSYTINWYDNGLLFATTSIPMVTYAKAAGTDNITATVIPSSLFCYDSSVSAVFTITDTNLYVKNIVAPQVYVYPNPAQTVLYVDNISASASYRLLSIIGSVLQEGVLQPGKNSLSIETMPKGLYMIEVTGDDGEKVVRKIVKE